MRPDGAAVEGGMATVYRAHDVGTGEEVALKVLHEGRGVAAAERFTHESGLLRDLAHPAIVRYIGHGTSSRGEPYLAMEWLEGETLEDRLKAGPLSLVATVRLGRRVLEALAVAHRKEIVHRDIKPANLFLPDGDLNQVKILDFGIARRFLDTSRVVTAVNAVAGTASYMSPEQIEGVADIDGRADIFSLGCVLHECLTGMPPRSSDTPSAEVQATVPGLPPATIESLRTDLPASAAWVLNQMIRKDREERPPSAAALATEFEVLLGSLPTLGYRASDRDQPLSAPPRRHLTVGEDRLEAVLLLSQVPEVAFSAVQRIADTFGAVIGQGPPGTIEVAFRGGTATPTDLAVQAARCALTFKATLPGSVVIALIMGRRGRDQALLGEGVPLLLQNDGTGIVVNQTTARLLQAGFELGGPKTDQLLFEKGGRDAPRTILGKKTPCVGREREIANLFGLWTECIGEPVARAMMVTAREGGGKTRVRLELLDRLRASGKPFEYLIGRGDSVRSAAPYAVIGAALRTMAGISGGEPPDVQRKRLLSHVQRHVAAERALHIAAFLGEIAGVHFPADELPALQAARHDARVMADQAMASWLDFLDAESAHHPVLVVLEDLHWGDVPSVQLVDAALRALPERPIFVLAFARPAVDDRFPKLWWDRGLQRLALAPLTPRSAQKLVHNVLGDDLPADRLAWIVDRGDGNPFDLEELIRAVADSAATPGSILDLPDTVAGMVQARFDALGTDAKRVLRAASVFGQTFSAAGILALIDDAGKDLDRWLDILSQREIIYSRQAGEVREYLFRQAVLQEAAYKMLTPEDSTAAHRMAGEFLTATGERAAILLVHHFELGGEPERAAYWCRFAAQQALDANDLDGVIERAARGAQLGAKGEALGVLRLLEAQARWWRAQYVEAEAVARDAIRLGDRATKVAATGELVAALAQQTKFEEVVELAEQLCVSRPEGEPEILEAWLAATYRAALCLFPANRLDTAERILGMIEKHTTERPVATGRLDGLRQRVAYARGQLVRARACSESAVAAFEQAGDLRSSTEYLINLGNVLCELGQLEDAHQRFRAALGVGERMNLAPVVLCSLVNLTCIESYRQNVEIAVDLGRRATELARLHGDLRCFGMTHIYLARNAHSKPDFIAAEEHAQASIEAFRNILGLLSTAMATMARALLAQNRKDEALACAQAADRLMSLHGVPEEGETLVRLVLAETLLAADDLEAGRDAVRTAWRLVENKAVAIDDLAARQTFLELIPDHAAIRALAHAHLGELPL
jgi:eukaryotic-like serine/threonine-protein kinase